MNILIVTPEYPPCGSGIANVVHSLKEHLQEKGVKVNVLSRGGTKMNASSSFDILPGLASLIPFWQKAIKFIVKKAEKYDAVWLHSPLLMNVKNLRKVSRVMVTMHTTYYGFYQAFKKHTKGYLSLYYYVATGFENILFKTLSLCPKIIITAVSPSVAEEVRRNGSSFLPRVVPNGLELIDSHDLDKHHIRVLLEKEYSLRFAEDDKVLLYVGRITEVKQPLLLIDLFKAISSGNPRIHMVVVGHGNLSRRVKRLAINQRNLHLLGHIPNRMIPLLLQAADASISLSCYEGLPLAVLEAATHNLPLILSDIPSHRWLLNSKVGHGILVNTSNPNIREISNLLEKTEDHKNSKNPHIIAQFSWDHIADQYIELFESFEYQ